MYQDHFGLQSGLFVDGIAQDTAVFLGSRQMLISAKLKIALTTRDAIAVLAGHAGVGKTTLSCHALRAATTRLALGWLGSPPLTADELLEQLLSEFSLDPHESSRVERLQTWRQFLNEMEVTDTRVCIVAENVQDFEIEVLQALQLLTAADPNGCPGANVVMTCRGSLSDVLALPALESLKQRIRLSCSLEPLTVEETGAYLRHKVALAGGDFNSLIAAGTIAPLQQYSGGVIRVINNLCESALTVAATRGDQQLTAQLVTRVAVGLFGMTPITGAPTDSQTASEPESAASEPAGRARGTEAANLPAAEAVNLPAVEAMDLAAVEAVDLSAAEAVELSAAEAVDFSAAEAVDLPAAEAADLPAAEAVDLPAAEAVDFVATDVLDPPATEAEDALDIEAARDPTCTTRMKWAPEERASEDENILETMVSTGTGEVETTDEEILTQANSGVRPMRSSADEIHLDSTDPATEEPDDKGLAADFASLSLETNEAPGLKPEEEDMQRQLEALANAKDLEDISNSMAETLFGNAELDQLSAELAAGKSAADNSK